MTLEYYKNFITIAESGSILAASQKLMIAQPALSNQLKAMERYYGVTLAVRYARGIALTPEGEILYQKAKSMVSLEEAARNDISNSVNGVTGSLSVALPPTNAKDFLSKVFSQYCQIYPNVNLHIHELTSEEVVRYVYEGMAEIGFVRAPIHNSERFDFYAMSQEPIVAYLPETHSLCEKDSIHIEDLKAQRIAIPRGCVMPIRDLCAKHMFEPAFACITTSRTVALHMAGLLNCIALVPMVGDGDAQSGFVMRKLAPKAAVVPRAVIMRKHAPISVQARNMLELIKHTSSDDRSSPEI